MNAGLRAAAKVGAALGLEVLGVAEGYRGLLEGRIEPLDPRVIDDAARHGGTVLGSARCKAFQTEEGQRRARERLIEARVRGLIVLGGNGSLTGAASLADAVDYEGRPLRVVGVPASIDNDVGCTAMAIGVDTALNTIVEACDRLADTAMSHKRTFLVEVMGRDCGYLAMNAGIAAAADAVLFREGGKTDEEIVDQVMRAVEAAYARPRGRRHVLIIKSEGVKLDSGVLKEAVDRRIAGRYPDVDTRVTVLGHVVRGGSPSAFDRLLASRLSNVAIRALHGGASQVMAGWAAPGAQEGVSAYDPHVCLVPLTRVLEETGRMHRGESDIVRWRVKALGEMEPILYL